MARAASSGGGEGGAAYGGRTSRAAAPPPPHLIDVPPSLPLPPTPSLTAIVSQNLSWRARHRKEAGLPRPMWPTAGEGRPADFDWFEYVERDYRVDPTEPE